MAACVALLDGMNEKLIHAPFTSFLLDIFFKKFFALLKLKDTTWIIIFILLQIIYVTWMRHVPQKNMIFKKKHIKTEFK